VVGMAECLAKPQDVDEELVCGMYRYASDAAEEAGDTDVQFRALVGYASLQRALRHSQKSAAVWDVALALARQQGDTERISYALTQLSLTLMSPHDESSVDVVNAKKEPSGHMSHDDGAPVVKNGPSAGSQRAVVLLAEVVALLPASADAAQEAKSRMNLAMALKAQGTKGQKREAEQEMIRALERLQVEGGRTEMEESVTAQLLELYEDNMWLVDESAKAKELLVRCHASVQTARARRLQEMVAKPMDPEERHASERAKWAAQKLANQLDSDDEDNSGPACPPENGWRR